MTISIDVTVDSVKVIKIKTRKYIYKKTYNGMSLSMNTTNIDVLKKH